MEELQEVVDWAVVALVVVEVVVHVEAAEKVLVELAREAAVAMVRARQMTTRSTPRKWGFA